MAETESDMYDKYDPMVHICSGLYKAFVDYRLHHVFRYCEITWNKADAKKTFSEKCIFLSFGLSFTRKRHFRV